MKASEHCIPRSQSLTNILACTASGGMKRSGSTESVRAKDRPFSSLMKKCRSVETLCNLKQNMINTTKINAPGMLYEIAKDGFDHIHQIDPSQQVYTTAQNELGTIVGNHVVQSTVISVLTHVAKHHPF